MISRRTCLSGLAGIVLLAACGGSDAAAPPMEDHGTPATIVTLGRGDFAPPRITGELAVGGNTAYTTTWGNRAATSVFYIWDITADVPHLIDSVRVDNATTLGDVAVSDDGSLLVVATEGSGSLAIYSLADARHPALLTRYSTPNTVLGVHTAEIGRVNGRLYGFLSIDPSGSQPARLVTLDLSDPSAPRELFTQVIGRPYVHDTFVRDGLLFLALWDDGVAIWDVGGGGRGGTPAAPVELGRVRTTNGKAHNVWWLYDKLGHPTRYAFVGEEGPGSLGASSVGDIHVVDVSDVSAPREVAFYTVAGAGTHNFSVDERSGVLYAAYYNGGVRALDVLGDLGNCTDAQKSTPGGSSVPLCDLRKMGRELGVGLLDRGNPVYVWGVQFRSGSLFASDMLNGLWKLRPITRP